MVIIIGAGISGLTLAYELQQLGVAYQLIEAADIPGGYIKTMKEGPYQYEVGPNSYLFEPELIDWVKSLGLADEVLFANEVSKHRFIWKQGQYRPLPQHPAKLMTSSFFSWQTKFKILAELGRKPSLTPLSDQTTVADFFADRFGQQVVDYAVSPFLSGIYGGDAKALLVKQTVPQVIDLDRKYGSILKGFAKESRLTARRQSLTFKNGMQVLPQTLASKLNSLYLGHQAVSIERIGQDWQIRCVKSDGTETAFVGSHLVLATTAIATAQLLADAYPAFANACQAIKYPYMVAVHTVYKKQDLKHQYSGFGGLHPFVEGRFTLGNIWTSQVFDGRCPEDEAFITSFVGGAAQEANARLSDAEILAKVISEHQEAYGITGRPLFSKVLRWPHAIPQYDQYQLAAQRAYESISPDLNLVIKANWLYGISLRDCIIKAREYAKTFVREEVR